MSKMMSKWFDRHDNLVSASMAFFSASMTSQLTVMDPLDLFCLRHIYSTISTMWYIPDSLLLWVSYSSLFTGVVHEADIMY